MDKASKDVLKDGARDLGTSSMVLSTFLLAALVAPLPRTWRAGIEERLSLDTDRVGVFSGLLQLGAGLALGFAGFFRYMNHVFAAIDASALERAQAGPGRVEVLETTMASYAILWTNPMIMLGYCFFTPWGLACTLTALGGLARTLGAASGQGNSADPTLSLVAGALQLATAEGRRRGREASKGAPEPDRLIPGTAAEPWDLRVVSQADYDWNVGVGVRALGEAYELVAKAEIRDERGRLRIAYDLRRLTAAEVMRGVRAYRPAERPIFVDRPAQTGPATTPSSRE